jgi:hypothetical protein
MEGVSLRTEHYIDLMQIHLLDGPRPVQVGKKVQNSPHPNVWFMRNSPRSPRLRIKDCWPSQKLIAWSAL